MKINSRYTYTDSKGEKHPAHGVTNLIKNAQLRSQAIGWHGKRCAKCGVTSTRQKEFVAHHRHYRSIGEEKPEDVVVLCKPCHKDIHDRSAARKLNKTDIPFVDPRWASWLEKVEP